MGNSYCGFGLRPKPTPALTEGWQEVLCVPDGPQRDEFSGNTSVRKQLAIAFPRKRTIYDKGGLCPTCKAGKQRNPPCIALRLPEEIWRLVAAHMSAAEWARVSSTSRELSRVQPETLCLAPSCMAGIHWAAAHWREAEFVALTVRGWEHQQVKQLPNWLDGLWLPDGRNFPTLQKVRHLAMHLEAGNPFETFNLWGILGASCTPKLESLCIVCDTSARLSAVPTLKQLRIEVKHQGVLCMIHGMDHYFQQLETLTICSDVHKYRWYQDFDLALMKSLRCVSLQTVLPKSLRVPPGCQVHFVCHDIFGASNAWDKGLGVACTSCHLVELPSSVQAALGRSSLLKCLQHIVGSSCPNLTVLKLSCSTVGSTEESLVIGSCLPALRELEIRAVQDLHLWVGTGVSLESLSIRSEYLHLEMEDPKRFVSQLKRVKFAYKNCCLDMILLLGKLNQVRRWRRVEHADGSTELHEAGAVEYSGVALETGGCRDHTCGACIDCLRRKHLPVSDNADWPFVGLFVKP